VEWSEELSSGLLRAAPDAILVMDGEFIVLVNDRAEVMFGWSRADLIGRPARSLLTE
jgi:two-component system cell cycle sensor histidine kinase/response regulator CckA